MKKTIYSILTLSLVLSGSLSFTACSSDDSTPVTEVKPNPEPGTEKKKLVLTTSAESAYLGDTIILKATLDGQDVTSTTVFYKDEVAITGNTISSDTETAFLIKAKMPNALDSDYVNISFVKNPFLTITGEGTFVYNGTSYQINGALMEILGYRPGENGTATIVWAQYAWSGNNPNAASNFVVVTFDTPATLVNGQITEYKNPDANQNIYSSIGFARLNDALVIAEEYKEGTGTVIYNSFDEISNPLTADFNIQITGTHNINFNYIGEISPTFSSRATAKANIKKIDKNITINETTFKNKFLKK